MKCSSMFGAFILLILFTHGKSQSKDYELNYPRDVKDILVNVIPIDGSDAYIYNAHTDDTLFTYHQGSYFIYFSPKSHYFGITNYEDRSVFLYIHDENGNDIGSLTYHDIEGIDGKLITISDVTGNVIIFNDYAGIVHLIDPLTKNVSAGHILQYPEDFDMLHMGWIMSDNENDLIISVLGLQNENNSATGVMILSVDLINARVNWRQNFNHFIRPGESIIHDMYYDLSANAEYVLVTCSYKSMDSSIDDPEVVRTYLIDAHGDILSEIEGLYPLFRTTLFNTNSNEIIVESQQGKYVGMSIMDARTGMIVKTNRFGGLQFGE